MLNLETDTMEQNETFKHHYMGSKIELGNDIVTVKSSFFSKEMYFPLNDIIKVVKDYQGMMTVLLISAPAHREKPYVVSFLSEITADLWLARLSHHLKKNELPSNSSSELLADLKSYIVDGRLYDYEKDTTILEAEKAKKRKANKISKISWIIAGIFITIWIIVISQESSTSAGATQYSRWMEAQKAYITSIILFVTIIVFNIFLWGAIYFRRRQRMNLRRTKQIDTVGAIKLLKTDNRAPIIFLRSFSSDERQTEVFRKIPSISEEEALLFKHSEKGPFIALASPGEPIPSLGAAKLYADNSCWQAVVELFVKHSAEVLIRFERKNSSKSLEWEITECLTSPNRAKCKLIFRSDDDFHEFKSKYAELFHDISFPEIRPKGAHLLNIDSDGVSKWEI